MITSPKSTLIQNEFFSNGDFDTFDNLMIGQKAKPAQWQPIDLRGLSPFQRALYPLMVR